MRLFILFLFVFLSIDSYAQSSCEDCAGSISVPLSVSGDIPPTGYTATYSWDSGVTSTTNSAIVTAAGVYTLTVTWTDNAGKCPDVVKSHFFTVTENPLPICAPTANTPLCEGEDLNLLANVSSGTGPFTYAWIGPDSFTSTDENPTITGITAAGDGTYTLTVTDSKGCESVACTVDVVINIAPVMTLVGNACN